MRVYHVFFWYADPDQRFLMRIRPNDTEPTGSGSRSETLPVIKVHKVITRYVHVECRAHTDLPLVHEIHECTLSYKTNNYPLMRT